MNKKILNRKCHWYEYSLLKCLCPPLHYPLSPSHISARIISERLVALHGTINPISWPDASIISTPSLHINDTCFLYALIFLDPPNMDLKNVSQTPSDQSYFSPTLKKTSFNPINQCTIILLYLSASNRLHKSKLVTPHDYTSTAYIHKHITIIYLSSPIKKMLPLNTCIHSFKFPQIQNMGGCWG